jgi:hypothetical protein
MTTDSASQLVAARRQHLDELFAPRSWTTGLFADFWSAPDLTYVPQIITDDVVGVWPGERIVRGTRDYLQVLKDLLTALPDLRLEVHEEATNGDLGFSRWTMHATGRNGQFSMVGMDRTRTRGGLVCENYVFFDNLTFRSRAGLT